MNWPIWKSSWRESLSIAMIALAVLMFGDAIYQTWMHFTWQTWLGKYAAAASPTTQPSTQPTTQASTQPSTKPAGTQSSSPPAARPGKPDKHRPDKPAKPVELSAAIRKRNIFAPPKPPAPPPALAGVMGNIALFQFGNETVGIKVGDSDRGITVKSINGYEVNIEFEGKPQTVNFASGSGAPSPGGPGAGPGQPRPMPPPSPGGPRPVPAAEGVPPGAKIDMSNLPPDVKEQIERSRSMER